MARGDSMEALYEILQKMDKKMWNLIVYMKKNRNMIRPPKYQNSEYFELFSLKINYT